MMEEWKTDRAKGIKWKPTEKLELKWIRKAVRKRSQ